MHCKTEGQAHSCACPAAALLQGTACPRLLSQVSGDLEALCALCQQPGFGRWWWEWNEFCRGAGAACFSQRRRKIVWISPSFTAEPALVLNYASPCLAWPWYTKQAECSQSPYADWGAEVSQSPVMGEPHASFESVSAEHCSVQAYFQASLAVPWSPLC